MISRKSKGAPPASEIYATAQRVVKEFWAGNGSDESFRLTRQVLEGHRLSKAQLDQLRLELPAATGPGTTAQKIRRADSLLLRLHAAA